MRRDHRNRWRMRFTRRQMLTAAASAGVGVAAVSVAGLSAAGDKPAAGAAGEPIVAHLRDPKSGTLEVFVGERRVELRDRDLAARLRRAARG